MYNFAEQYAIEDYSVILCENICQTYLVVLALILNKVEETSNHVLGIYLCENLKHITKIIIIGVKTFFLCPADCQKVDDKGNSLNKNSKLVVDVVHLAVSLLLNHRTKLIMRNFSLF